MRPSLRRQLKLLRAYAMVNSIVLVVLATAAFRQGTTSQRFDEITVQRMNVADANGTLRLVIANKDRMHPGQMDGKVIDRPRPVAGLLFFNEEGDEVGGLTFTGREVNGVRQANAGLMFDQFKQDQTIGFSYSEGGGRRTAGFQVWDRSDTRLSELIDKLNAANRIPDAAQREAEIAKVRAAAPPGPRRIFVGKNSDRAATVSLADADGKPRLTLTVDAGGSPRIEFLDADGNVVARMPQDK
jgi:catechol 2,3-dioxygenase-like lactoylglutathione lyase family enzyme